MTKLTSSAVLLTHKHNAFSGNVAPGAVEELISPVVLLVHQLKHFEPQLLRSKRAKRIVIAGAGEREVPFGGVAFKFLDHLVSFEGTLEIDLLSFDMPEESTYKASTDIFNQSALSNKIKVNLLHSTLGQYLSNANAPKVDVIIANAPGFDSRFQDWFQDDIGLNQAAEAGIPVLGSSHGFDEVLSDRFIAQIFGFDVVDHQVTDFAKATDRNANGFSSDSFGWGGTIWRLAGDGRKQDADKFEWLTDRISVLNETYKHLYATEQIEEPTQVFNNIHVELMGNPHIRIFGPILYDLEAKVLREETSRKVVSEVDQIDTTYFDMSKLDQPYHALMLMTSIYRDHVKSFVVEKEDVTIDVSDLILKNDPAVLGAIPIVAWHMWRGLAGENALHVAAEAGNIHAFMLAIESGLEIGELDKRGFSVIDYAVLGEHKEMLLYILSQDLPVDLVNNRSIGVGTTAAMKAAENGNQELIDVLVQYGADLSVKSNIGISAADLLS